MHSQAEQFQLYELLNALLDDELSPEARAQLEAHLCECESCRSFFESLRQTLELYHRLDEHNPALPHAVEERLRRFIKQKQICKS